MRAKKIHSAAVFSAALLAIPAMVVAKGHKNQTGTVTGSEIQLSSALSYPTPTAPTSATDLGKLVAKDGKTVTLTSGTYECSKLKVRADGTLNIEATNGPVIIYCDGQFICKGNINVTGNLPKNFQVYMTSAAAVELFSGTNYYAVIHAPASVVTLEKNVQFYGSCLADQVDLDKNSCMHFDQALGTNGTGPGPIGMVK